MGSIRKLIVQHFSLKTRTCEPENEVADALYSLLRMSDLDVAVDGWEIFHIVHEADNFLEAVGLMTLLPKGSIPIAVRIEADLDGFSWSAQIGREDDSWLAMSESKRWKSVYLYATGDLGEPRWTWNRQYQGTVRRTDA